MEKRDEKSIYTYYKSYDSYLIDCVYQAVKNPKMKDIFIKKWGIYFRGPSYVSLKETENQTFYEQADILEKYLVLAQKLQDRGYNYKQIQNYFANVSNQSYVRKTVPIYPNLIKLLEQYHLHQEDLEQILRELPNDVVNTFIELYIKKRSIVKIASRKRTSIETIINQIAMVYNKLETYQMEIQLQNQSQILLKYTVFTNVEEILKHYNITLEELEQIIIDLPKYERVSFIYTYGMDDRPILKANKIAKVLDCKEEDIFFYLDNVYRAIEKYKNKDQEQEDRNDYELEFELFKSKYIMDDFSDEIKKEEISQNKIQKKESILEYCKKEDIPYGIIQIEWWKNHNKKYYDVIVKLCGETYDKYDETVVLTKEEKYIWRCVISSFQNEIAMRKKEEASQNNNQRKEGMFDYCKKEDIPYAIMQIEFWKYHYKKYYDVIVKLCGETYDKYDETAVLTKEEKYIWKCITSNFRSGIERRKREEAGQNNNQRKESMLDYCQKEDIPYAIMQIEWWKDHNKKYYDVIVKLYGEKYNKLDRNAVLTVEENDIWRNIRSNFQSGIERRKREEAGQNSNQRKESMFDYCKKEDIPYAIMQIERWKDYNKKYYDVIVKLYGPKYNKLNRSAILTKEEHSIWRALINNFRSGIERRKKEMSKYEQRNQNNLHEKSQNEILIKDIFSQELMIVERYMHMEMKNATNKKNVLESWNVLESLSYKSIEDHNALYTMMDLLNQIQNTGISIIPIDENVINGRVKKMQL